MKRIIFFILITTIAFSACKNEDNDPQPLPESSVLKYFPLTVGNYWVYEQSLCDSTWIDCESKSIDTNFVTKDTLINDLKYYKIEGVGLLGHTDPIFLRDSLNYIVDVHGTIHISDTDFENKISERYVTNSENDTVYYLYRQIKDMPNNIEVPVGIFNCLDNKTYFYRSSENFEQEFNTHYLFAKDIGPVYENVMFAGSLGGYKKELVDYNILSKDNQ